MGSIRHEAVICAADQVTDCAADAARRLAGGVADLARDANGAVHRRDDRERARLPGCVYRSARDSEADLRLAEQLRDRVVVLAGKIARCGGIERMANGRERDGDRRNDM